MQSKRNTERTDKRRINLRRLALFLAVLLLAAVWAAPYGAQKLGEALYPLKYRYYVEYWAEYHDVDPLAVYAIIRTESGFDANAENDVPARGLMQITEETFAWIRSKIAMDEPVTFDDLFDPEMNIRFGSYYLSRCLDRYGGDLATAAAAYHSGWGTVDRLLEDPAYAATENTLAEFPYEQMNLYVYKVEKAYSRYCAIYKES